MSNRNFAIEGAIPLVDVFDVGREDASLHVCASCSKQDVVGVPFNGEHGGSNGFLQKPGDPPVAFGVE